LSKNRQGLDKDFDKGSGKGLEMAPLATAFTEIFLVRFLPLRALAYEMR
jgi:hypothetical protein